MSNPYRAMCAELTTALEYVYDGRRPKVVQELIDRALALLEQTELEGEGLTEIALRMLGTIESMELIIPEITDTIRKALEQGHPAPQSEPEGLTDEELRELRRKHDWPIVDSLLFSVARAAIAADRARRPAPQPPAAGEVAL